MERQYCVPVNSRRAECVGDYGMKIRAAFILYGFLSILQALLLMVDALSYIIGSLTFGRVMYLNLSSRLTNSRVYLAIIGWLI